MDEKERKQVKQEYLKSLYSDYKYSIERFDHQSLYIAGGALALSLTFLNAFIEIKTAKCLIIFIGAIILFVVTIGCGFYTHFKSAQKINQRIDQVRRDDYNFETDKLISRLNKALLILLMSGLTSLVTFCILNLII
jgi:hypothetical protein